MHGDNPFVVLVLPAMCQAHLRLFCNSSPAPRIRILPSVRSISIPSAAALLFQGSGYCQVSDQSPSLQQQRSCSKDQDAAKNREDVCAGATGIRQGCTGQIRYSEYVQFLIKGDLYIICEFGLSSYFNIAGPGFKGCDLWLCDNIPVGGRYLYKRIFCFV